MTGQEPPSLPPFTFGELFGIFGKSKPKEIMTCMYFIIDIPV
jgi:hypothetical protein